MFWQWKPKTREGALITNRRRKQEKRKWEAAYVEAITSRHLNEVTCY